MSVPISVEAFYALVRALPEEARTVGDLLDHLDSRAHEAEEGSDWWEAAHFRETQACVLRFIQAGIDGGVIDVAAAVAVTRERESGRVRVRVPFGQYGQYGQHAPRRERW